MPLITDFNRPPYYDDFDELKNFHRILFKPAVAVQARELTQLQTILQNQVERFGSNILREGTIVAGGNFVEEVPLPYVKVRDIAFDSNNQEVATDVNLYTGMKAVGKSTGVEGFVITTKFGLETQNPNLATLYIRYINSGDDGRGNNVSTFSNTEEIELYAEDPQTGEYSTLFHRVTAAGEVDAVAAVGDGYGVRCGDGIVFQKGNFIRFEDGLTIVEKYHTRPDGIVVGFETEEIIVDSNEDSSLLDPASGFNNCNAPGADRVQLIPRLVVRTLAEAEEDEHFFALQEYEDGNIVRRNLATEYSHILDMIEKRAFEESGDYVVRPFSLSSRGEASANGGTEIVVSAGLGYVNGKRVETHGDIGVTIPQANTTGRASNQDIIANYGYYYIVTPVGGVLGSFDFANVEQVEFVNASNKRCALARVRAVTNHTIPGQYRIYVMDIEGGGPGGSIRHNARKIKSFGGGTGEANIVLESGKAIAKDTNNYSAIYPLGRSSIRTVEDFATDYIFRKSITTTSSRSGSIVATVSGDEQFPYTTGQNLNSDQIAELLVIAAASSGPYSVGEPAAIDSVYVNSAQELTIQLAVNPAGSMAVEVISPVKNTTVTFNQKTLQTAYVKINCNSHDAGVNGGWSLGFPDVYRIKNVYRNSNSSFAGIKDPTNLVTNHFYLAPGQWHNVYRLSQLKRRGRGLKLTASDRLLVEVEVFKKDSNPGSFFTVDSYPIDDISETLPAGFIRTQDIPSASGFRLRDSIDLRPQPANTAVYATTPSAATVNPSNTHIYAGSSSEFPAPNATIETSYEYYLGRVDKLIVDEYGDFQIVEGTPDEIPVSPRVPDRSMEVATIQVPPFPTLSSSVANRAGKPDYGVSYSTRQNRRYTMKDIGDIDRRIENLEYYTALSALESATADMVITDGDGMNKFKNGIFVDNFTNFMLADIHNDDFAASLDPARDVVQPRFRQYPIDLRYESSSSNVNRRFDVAMFNSTENVLISQPYATTTRSCTTDFYKYAGNMQLNPEFDPGPETQTAPDINIDIDLATPLIEFTEALSEMIPLQQTSREVDSSLTRTSTTEWIDGGSSGQITTTTTTTTSAITNTLEEISVSAGQQVTRDLGDFVTDVSFSPYMRPRRIEIYITGLRPNTRHYFFFDSTPVGNWVAPGRVLRNGRSPSSREIGQAGAFGSAVRSDRSGVISAIFWLPADRFFVGDARMEVSDRPKYEEMRDATSTAAKTYTAFNFSSTTTGMAVSTRPPEISHTVTSNTSVTTNVSTVTRVDRWDLGYGDPIAQTFFVDPNYSHDNSVMISGIDLFFASRSRTNNGITVQIREVDNGYPAGKIVPMSNVHLTRDEVNVNSRSATIATQVKFDNPVILRTGREYAFVLKPDGNDPDYRVWISRIGQTDVDRGIAITQDTNTGTLFTSTNNRAWTPYQDENIKYKLHRYVFPGAASGHVNLTNRDHEFFDIENVSGHFQKTELVFREARAFNGAVSITKGSNVITGQRTAFNTQYQEGQFIVIKYATNKFELLRIKQIVSNTRMIARVDSQITATTGTHYSSPVGRLEWFTLKNPAQMILIDSTASSSLRFAANDTLRGADSAASADLVLVDDLPISYIEPKIYRANFNRTSTTLSASKLYNGSSASNARNLQFNASNFLHDDTYYIRSKSNNPTSSSFQLRVNMGAEVNHTSPMIDHKICSMMAYRYLVNNDGSGETAELGNAESKYISKEIVLADGQDSEDIRVFIDAYRPPQTDIHVYAKFLSREDIRDFKDIEWTRLNMSDSSNVFSSSANRNDYREFEFQLKTTAPSPAAGGGAYYDIANDRIEYRDEDGNIFNDFRSFAIKIVILAPGHNITPQIKNLRAIALS